MMSFGQEPGWRKFRCPGATQRWRRIADGRIEVESVGIPGLRWRKPVDQWADIVAAKSAKYKVPATWIAAIIALESGGIADVCYRPGGKGTPCSPADGAGLMAMLPSTATWLAGKTVTIPDLQTKPDLAVDLGTKFIDQLRKKLGGDYVEVAMGYNASYSPKTGYLKCGTTTSGRTLQKPKEPCPPTPWGVIMGCVRTSKKWRASCGPSKLVPGKWVCPNDYPMFAIKTFNAAVENGWTDTGLGKKPTPVTPTPVTPRVEEAGFLAYALPFAAAGLLSYWAVKYSVMGETP